MVLIALCPLAIYCAMLSDDPRRRLKKRDGFDSDLPKHTADQMPWPANGIEAIYKLLSQVAAHDIGRKYINIETVEKHKDDTDDLVPARPMPPPPLRRDRRRRSTRRTF